MSKKKPQPQPGPGHRPKRPASARPVGEVPKGLPDAAGDGSAEGRTLGLAALVLGIGGLLTSPFLFGGVLGGIAVVLGIVAIVKSRLARKRIKAEGGEPRTGGAFGLGLIGVFTGVIAIVIPIVLLQTANDMLEPCKGLPEGSPDYDRCVADQFRQNAGRDGMDVPADE